MATVCSMPLDGARKRTGNGTVAVAGQIFTTIGSGIAPEADSDANAAIFGMNRMSSADTFCVAQPASLCPRQPPAKRRNVVHAGNSGAVVKQR